MSGLIGRATRQTSELRSRFKADIKMKALGLSFIAHVSHTPKLLKPAMDARS